MNRSESIKRALDRAAHMLSLRPAKGQRTYVSTATVIDGVRCDVREGKKSLSLDLPPSMGGEDVGPSPSVLLRAAMSGCTAMGVKMWAARRGVPVDRVDVELETDVDARGQFAVCDDVTPGFERVRLTIRVSSPAPRQQIEEITELALRYSPLSSVFQETHNVKTELALTPEVEHEC